MASHSPLTRHPVRLEMPGVAIVGDLTVPEGARGIVVFAHGSGSSRHSSRNQQVATTLNFAGLATLLVDLLTADEERIDAVTAALRFDIGLLGTRVTNTLDWISTHDTLASLPIGVFGASTGAAAALVAAAERPKLVAAVVSRGGRPDLADAALEIVTAPTLLIVGSRDEMVIDLNRKAMARMSCDRELRIVPGASHLFEEPGALDEVARLAVDWYLDHR